MNNLSTKFLNLFSLLILTSLTILLVGCKKNNTTTKTNVTPTEEDGSELEKTGYNIVENGESEYKIVIPEDAGTMTMFAANELSEYLFESTGVSLEIVTENGLTLEKTSKYIAIGETTFIETAGVTIDKEELGYTGFVLKTYGESLIIGAVTRSSYTGEANGVYEFLEKSIGFKVYASDEIVYDKLSTVPLYNFDYSDKSDCGLVEEGFMAASSNKAYSSRLKTEGVGDSPWASFGHTHITDFLKTSIYYESHPEWYVNGGQQLCLSNDEVVEEMILKVEERLTKYPEKDYIMLGHEDNSTYCTCEKCSATMEKYGGCFSGVELEFTTKVAKAVDKWLESAYPGRHVKYAFFAYGPTITAPATYDAETDTFTMNNPDTEIYENVCIYIAPLEYNFSKSPYDSENTPLTTNLKAWAYLLGNRNLIVWNYGLASYSYMFNFNNFGVVQEYYRLYNDLGVEYMFDQGTFDSITPSFEELRLYVQSQLSWDSTQEYDVLAEDFINQYYGPAASSVMEYYQLIRAHYHKLNESNYSTGMVFFMYDDKNLWDEGLVRTLMAKLDSALESIKSLEESDPQTYEKYLKRIEKERLSPIYMTLQYYIDDLSDEERISYVKEFKKYANMFGITNSRESSCDILSIISTWESY